MSQSLLAIETLCLDTTVTEHFEDLCVLYRADYADDDSADIAFRHEFAESGELTLTILLEHQLSLLIIVLVLSPSPVLSSLSLVLRHV